MLQKEVTPKKRKSFFFIFARIAAKRIRSEKERRGENIFFNFKIFAKIAAKRSKTKEDEIIFFSFLQELLPKELEA